MSTPQLEKGLGGLWWPVSAGKVEEIRHLILDTAGDMQAAVNLCPFEGLAIQAGGNVGAWPLWLAERFRFVITCEPEPTNFRALDRNLSEAGVTNVDAIAVALGPAPGSTGLRLSPKNIGAHRVEGDGEIRMTTIDVLVGQHRGYGAPDLIALDVEGFELPALRGAHATLDAYRPVVMVEDRRLGIKTGNGSIEEIAAYLGGFGYTERARVNYDVIFSAR